MFNISLIPIQDSEPDKWTGFGYPKTYVYTGDAYRLDTKKEFKHFSLPTIRTLEAQGTDTGVKVIDDSVVQELNKQEDINTLIKNSDKYYRYYGFRQPKEQICEYKDLTPKIKQWETEMQEIILNTIQTIDFNDEKFLNTLRFLKFLKTICGKPFQSTACKFSDSEHNMYMDYAITDNSIEIYSYLTDNAVYSSTRMNKICVLTGME